MHRGFAKMCQAVRVEPPTILFQPSIMARVFWQIISSIPRAKSKQFSAGENV
jgi:hypothetical protein